MLSAGSFPHLIALAVAISAWIIFFRGKPQAHTGLSLLNAVFIALVFPDIYSLALVAGYQLLLFGLIQQNIRGKLKRGGTWLLAGLVVLFLYLKQYEFVTNILPQHWLLDNLELVGLSYMLFKGLHVYFDAREGEIKDIRFSEFLNYQFYFPTLLAGPMQRYHDFIPQWRALPEQKEEESTSIEAWHRVFNGFLKIALAAPLCVALQDKIVNYANYNRSHKWEKLVETLPWISDIPGLQYWIATAFILTFIYSAFGHIYFNFSGYCDIAIGVARLMGIIIPENFNKPWRARNLIEFWNRWHITLTHWIRDYLFMRNYKRLAERIRNPLTLRLSAYLLLFTSLLIAGIWHGSTLNFVIFGLWHGIGVFIVEIYGDTIKKFFGKRGYRKYMAKPFIKLLCILITFTYFSASLVLFETDLNKLNNDLKALSTPSFLTQQIHD